MQYGTEMRRCLEDMDVERARRLWAYASPHLPQPETDGEAVAVMHHARTAAGSVPMRARAYSHRWLLDHGLPSGLPDGLKPKAERMYPRIVTAVGIAVKAMSEHHKPLARAVQRAMSDAVADCYANGDTAPEIVKSRMLEARLKAYRG